MRHAEYPKRGPVYLETSGCRIASSSACGAIFTMSGWEFVWNFSRQRPQPARVVSSETSSSRGLQNSYSLLQVLESNSNLNSNDAWNLSPNTLRLSRKCRKNRNNDIIQYLSIFMLFYYIYIPKLKQKEQNQATIAVEGLKNVRSVPFLAKEVAPKAGSSRSDKAVEAFSPSTYRLFCHRLVSLDHHNPILLRKQRSENALGNVFPALCMLTYICIVTI